MISLRNVLTAFMMVFVLAPANAQTWDETADGGSDAGDSQASAQDLTGAEYTLITGTLSASGDVDLYKINIVDPANFTATTVKSSYGGSDLTDSWLYLFDSAGNAVYSNDETPAGDVGFNSLLPKTGDAIQNPDGYGPTTAGVYYLAVAAYEETANDVSAANLFQDPRDYGPDWQRINGPNPSASTLWSWNHGGVNTGNYEVSLSGVTLPVEFAAIDAAANDQSVTIRWTTLSETNNAGFDVEIAGAAKQFLSVGFVSGNGTTTETNEYSFVVEGLAYGMHSFRLRQVDYDGTSSYSPVVEVNVELPVGYSVTTAYPNPFSENSRLDITVREEQDVTVELYNVLGQKVSDVYSGRVAANQSRTITFNADGLASGQYLLHVKGDAFRDTQLISLTR